MSTNVWFVIWVRRSDGLYGTADLTCAATHTADQHNPCCQVKEATIKPSQDLRAAHLPRTKETGRRQAEENSHCKSTQSEKQKMLWRSALWVNRRDSWCFFPLPLLSALVIFYASLPLSTPHLHPTFISFPSQSNLLHKQQLNRRWSTFDMGHGGTMVRLL